MKRICRPAVWVSAASVVLLVSACASAPTEVDHDQVYLPDFPDLLVAHSPVEPPPGVAAYLAATWQEREAMLVDAYNRQTVNVSTCNIDKDNISSWWSQQKAAVAHANGAAAPPPPAASQTKVAP